MNFTYDLIWDNQSEFTSHNFKSPEALISQYAVFTLSKKNIITKDCKIPEIYFRKVKVRSIRTYHGKFFDGLTNIKTIQR